MRVEDVIRRPLLTEKSNIAREERNEYVFAVDPLANKHEIKRAVEELFGVRVLRVRTARMPAKKRRVGRFVGTRPRWKKAFVQLAEGQSIEFFEGV